MNWGKCQYLAFVFCLEVEILRNIVYFASGKNFLECGLFLSVVLNAYN